MNPTFKRITSSIISITFLLSNLNLGYAQLALPAPGTMLQLSPGFNPPIIKGITLHPENPLQFDFIVNKGDSHLTDQELREVGLKMVKYFLASLTIPNKEMWVNLSPAEREKDRIIAPSLGETELGKDLLSQDYILKQLTSSIMHPEGELGKKFWEKVYSHVRAEARTTDIPLDTLNRVWIVPDKAVVYEHEQSAFVVERHLKVMLEEDYLSSNQKQQPPTTNQKLLNSFAKSFFRLWKKKLTTVKISPTCVKFTMP